MLKVDVPILTCICFTFNWLTLTSEMHFVKFHPEVASCLLSRGKRKYAPLGMRLLWKYIRNDFLVYQLILHFLLYLQNYKEFEAEILDLQSEKYGLSFDIKKYTTSGWALGDENMIGIRAFNVTGSALSKFHLINIHSMKLSKTNHQNTCFINTKHICFKVSTSHPGNWLLANHFTNNVHTLSLKLWNAVKKKFIMIKMINMKYKHNIQTMPVISLPCSSTLMTYLRVGTALNLTRSLR